MTPAALAAAEVGVGALAVAEGAAPACLIAARTLHPDSVVDAGSLMGSG